LSNIFKKVCHMIFKTPIESISNAKIYLTSGAR